MPEMPDVVSGEIIESEWGNDIRDRTIQRYASITERSSLNASPDPGDFSFLEDTGIVSVFFAGSWRNIFYNSVEHGAAMALDAAVAEGFSTMVSETFAPPATWVTYKLSASGTAAFNQLSGTVVGVQARLNIAGSIGPTAAGGASVPTLGVAHSVSGLSGSSSIVVQGRKGAGGGNYECDAALSYIATRVT